ncbi:Respiratory supercomplex factor 1, mitochondrial [Marasmius tenuissimus]|nr:Respiratory supercomplex factor 1, mitochondrial [Marasmius tenuissimus]
MVDIQDTTPVAGSSSDSGIDPVAVYGFSERRFTETYGEKAIRKCKENPIVPLGALATAGALIMASVRLRGGTSKQFQTWLRARVVFQTLTIVAVCGGVYQFGQSNIEENQKALEIHKELVETKAARDRAAFDERMRQAEIAQAQDEAILAARKALESQKETKGKGWWPWSSSEIEAKAVPTLSVPKPEVKPKPEPSSPVSHSAAPSSGGSSWLGWLGWK